MTPVNVCSSVTNLYQINTCITYSLFEIPYINDLDFNVFTQLIIGSIKVENPAQLVLNTENDS